ncbi:glutamine-dependent NAD(+) synthetase [bacterium BMS3Abin05]|nr:glutamine-dependent NAD(+) synthetase [bacterium BMS3Abin05]GBE26997.1 glutamine-dependent NAD(+) synthetase [bacterium BMS3Bbin03]HDZ10970.1 NAD+ synthase [Bacteroidota bacterium]
MAQFLRIAQAQINTIVGDLTGNRDKILEWVKRAEETEADIVIFPELAITGYPPEDLLMRPKFIEDNLRVFYEIASKIGSATTIVGFADREDGRVYNAAGILHQGRVEAICHKIQLPNYGVFDEKRYFQAGTEALVFERNEVMFGINICEDIWVPGAVIETQAFPGDSEVILNISASPYHVGKGNERKELLKKRAIDSYAYIVYTNLIGGQDELVFDGMSVVFSPKGNVLAQGAQFKEDLVVTDLDIERVRKRRREDPLFMHKKFKTQAVFPIELVRLPEVKEKARKRLPRGKTESVEKPEEIYKALMLGTRDYVHKNGFKKVVIGLSGGIDSTLVAAIAVDALGAGNVVGVGMPSKYSSKSSVQDAETLAKNLDIPLMIIPIQSIFDAYLKTLKETFKNLRRDITEENLQARIRGNILMALSNKFGWLVLTTGNKSETSVGYSTLYGDTAGGFAVIKDVPKLLVYDLCKYRNRKAGRMLIPENVLSKPPSAELRPNQKDEDSLPPYSVLDPILEAFVEQELSPSEIIAKGFPEDVVIRVAQMVDHSEYKRRQSPPGIKITPRAFGRDRRMPITNRYRF